MLQNFHQESLEVLVICLPNENSINNWGRAQNHMWNSLEFQMKITFQMKSNNNFCYSQQIPEYSDSLTDLKRVNRFEVQMKLMTQLVIQFKGIYEQKWGLFWLLWVLSQGICWERDEPSIGLFCELLSVLRLLWILWMKLFLFEILSKLLVIKNGGTKNVWKHKSIPRHHCRRWIWYTFIIYFIN